MEKDKLSTLIPHIERAARFAEGRATKNDYSARPEHESDAEIREFLEAHRTVFYAYRPAVGFGYGTMSLVQIRWTAGWLRCDLYDPINEITLETGLTANASPESHLEIRAHLLAQERVDAHPVLIDAWGGDEVAWGVFGVERIPEETKNLGVRYLGGACEVWLKKRPQIRAICLQHSEEWWS